MKKLVKGCVAAIVLASALVVGAPSAFAWQEVDYFIANGHGTISPSYLVIHSTANPGATAWDHVTYWNRVGNDAPMAQWVCDWTNGGTVYQVMPGNAKAWHVGNGNNVSVGIEICEGTTREQVDTALDTAAQWAAHYLNQKGWGINRMVSHNDARTLWGGTTHTDPIPYLDRWGYSWNWFKSRVQAYMDGSADAEPAPGSGNRNNAPAAPTGSVESLAAAVMRGDYGSGQARRDALGSRYEEVQAYVNSHYFGIGSGSGSGNRNNAPAAPTGSGHKTTAELAAAVMRGDYGSGQARRDALGSRYEEVQAYVNSHYFGIGSGSGSGHKTTAELAAAVMRGDYGSGQARRDALGSRYNEVQAYVNRVYYKIY